MPEDSHTAEEAQTLTPPETEVTATSAEHRADDTAVAAEAGTDATSRQLADAAPGEEPTSAEKSASENEAALTARVAGNGDESPPRSDTSEEGTPAVCEEAAPTDGTEAPGQAVPEFTEPGTAPANTTRFEPPDFSADRSAADMSQIDLLDDVELDVKIELGRTEMYIEDVLALGAGSVVELDKPAGDPVDIYVNDRLVARGEVLVLNDNFCVRINDILSPTPELELEK